MPVPGACWIIKKSLSLVGRIMFKPALVVVLAVSTGLGSAEPYPLTKDYCNLFVTYALHAKSLWHDGAEGGYWGDGFDHKNQNGAVRGNCNTLLTYAMLVRGLDSGWLQPADVKALERAGLDRHEMIKYIRQNLAYLVAHHKSAAAPAAPAWGYSWQSSLWMQSLGPAVLLSWNEIGNDLKDGVARVAAAEADWVASRPPKDHAPGDTGAEENAWNTAAPAVALALKPDATSSTLWWKTLRSYSVNTFSHPADKRSSQTVGQDKVSELVSTTNVSADWSLINHGFFHPDYVQVSGQHLGEAWIILTLGDAVNGTNLAEQYVPYSLHNVRETWENVMRPLLLPTGEFAYPAGNDWTYHCSTNQGYFAFIATALDSYDAAEAEARALEHVKARREAGPVGRLLGDSNLEWWWEPLVCKRMATALLHHILRPGIIRRPDVDATIDRLTTTVQLSDANIWWHRTPHYFFSVSSKKPKLAYFAPLGGYGDTAPYTTLPGKGSLLPKDPWDFQPQDMKGEKQVAGGTFWRDGKAIGAVLCMQFSTVILSRDGFRALPVENDSLTDPGRTVTTVAGSRFFPALKKKKGMWLPGPWLCVDNAFGFISPSGFRWDPAGGWNQKSVAVDKVGPRADAGAWQMLTADEEATRATAAVFAEDVTSTGVVAIIKDGPQGKRYRARLTDNGVEYDVLAE